MKNLFGIMTLLLLAGTVVSCAEDTQTPNVSSDDPFVSLEDNLSGIATPCTWDAETGTLAVTLAADEVVILTKRTVDSAVTVNGEGCGVSRDTFPSASRVRSVTVSDGEAGAQTLILDYTNGLFATGSARGVGIAVDLGDDAGDLIGVRGQSKTDIISVASLTNDDGDFKTINMARDSYPDVSVVVTAVNTEFTVAMGEGADTFNADTFADPITVYGGGGIDTFNQGAAATPNETIYGGEGLDILSYANRTEGVTANLAVGVAAETDVISGVETLTGSAYADTLTGSAGDDTINGGGGNDTITGAAGNDTLNGGDGNDTFVEGAADSGSDVFNGGAGIDDVDYSGRDVNAVHVTMDGVAADDGEYSVDGEDVYNGEADNVKADVENITCGDTEDTVVGNALANVIDGGPGNDTLSGAAGNDVFPQGSVEPDAIDADADTISGGAGVDTVDYSDRAGDLLVTLGTGSGASLVQVADDGTADVDGDTEGAQSEGDNLHADVENVYGGDGDDDITGNESANELVGGAGVDTLTGGAGDDTLEGGDGTDADDLTCGDGDGDIGFGTSGDPDVSCEFGG